MSYHGGLTWQRFIFSWFWRLEVQDQGVGMLVSSEVSLLGSQMVTFLLWLHKVFPLCANSPAVYYIQISSYKDTSLILWASLVAQMIKNLPTVWEIQVQSLGREDPLEKGMATHSTILAWRIPWTEEPDEIQSRELQKSQTWLSKHSTA